MYKVVHVKTQEEVDIVYKILNKNSYPTLIKNLW